MGKKILICDDEPSIVESLSYLARREGYEAVTAQDGNEALAKAKGTLPDLILLDLMMPGKSGFEVCRELRRDSRTKGIYIAILTARGEESDEIRGKVVGADDYITKPFSPRQLRARIHEILG
jgi:two-component system, OmpR family, alkaline phosphatase synthesis response regulator PhoP